MLYRNRTDGHDPLEMGRFKNHFSELDFRRLKH